MISLINLEKACTYNYYRSKNGLNMDDLYYLAKINNISYSKDILRKDLLKLICRYRKEKLILSEAPEGITESKEIEEPIREVREKDIVEDKSYYFNSRGLKELSDKKQKWCRCILHVAAGQPKWCLEDLKNNIGKMRDGKKCYSPYAICSKSIGTRAPECNIYLNRDRIPEEELISYDLLRNKLKE